MGTEDQPGKGDGRLGQTMNGHAMATYPAMGEDVECLVIARNGVVG